MITVKHPDPNCNKQQEAFMSACSQNQRRFHELLFTYGNIVYRYHDQAHKFETTKKDWAEYLEGCEPGFRKVMADMGFEQGRRVLHFTRFVMERNDVGLVEYVRLHMAPQDYADYQLLVEKVKPQA